MINIRKAQREDCSRLMELVHELAVYEKAPEEVTIDIVHFIESGFGNHPVWWAWVAEEDGIILGFALYYIRFSTWKGQRMYLEDILVTEAARRRGIGTLLFEQLKKDAKEKKLNAICWQVLNWNQPGIDFYKKWGASFDDEWMNCVIEID